MKQTVKSGTAKLHTDLVIIGSGGAGLAAAVSASEKGVKDILILEKRGNLGGNSARAEGLFACESPVQKRLGIQASRDDYFKKAMKWAHWSRVNPRVVRAYINKSGDTIRWFEEKGVNFEVVPSQPGQLPCLGADQWHLPARGPEGRNGARLIKILDKQFKDAGGRLMLKTACKKILRGKKGEVTGVLAVKDNGEEFWIDTRSVIIATGGFASNKDLLKKYCPEYREEIHFDENAVPNMGDGLLLAAETGAAISDAVGVLREGPRSNYKGRFPVFFLLSPHTLWVNKRGKRFIDEGAGYMAFESVNALLMQPDYVMYTIFDSITAQDLTAIYPEEVKRLSHGLPPFATPDEKELRKMADSDSSTFKISDSWDEIADWIGADPTVLKDTVNKYNSFYYRGYDEEFAKDVRLLHPVNKAPYYAIKGIITMIDTLGGIKTNECMEVLDNKENMIPGLYAAGVIVDGFEGQTYDSEMAGSALGFSINSGRIAGESTAKFILQ